VQDIQPVKMTYTSEWPMIPLRLTAVAANPNMGVLVWFLGNTQYENVNYKTITISDDEIQFFPFGGSNYFALRSQKIDEVKGQGLITEFAGPTANLAAADPDLSRLLGDYAYLTRMYTEISPEEMTVDPTFRYNESLPPLSNVHDLSNAPSPYACEQNTIKVEVPQIVQDVVPTPVIQEVAPAGSIFVPKWLAYLGVAVAIGGVLLVAGFVISRARRK
jgi:hypothetical protein